MVVNLASTSSMSSVGSVSTLRPPRAAICVPSRRFRARTFKNVHTDILHLAQRLFCTYNNCMELEFDPNKRDMTLMARGLDFSRAGEVFAGRHFTVEDTREDRVETRHITVGRLKAE